MIVYSVLIVECSKKDTNHQNGKGRVRQRKTHQRKKSTELIKPSDTTKKQQGCEDLGYVKQGR